jgi:hypothetical protein
MNLPVKIHETDYDEAHLKDVQDLFNRVRGGTYIQHAFVTPRQLSAWSEFMKWPFYYASRNEPLLIPIAARETAKLIRHPQSVIGVENGPGTESGVKLKTIPYYSRIPGLHTLVGRDWSDGVGKVFNKVVKDELLDVDPIFNHSNFNRDRLPLGLPKGQRAFAEFGFSRGNLEGKDEDGYPMHVLEADADHLVSLMNHGDTYAVTIDANPNTDDILRCYSPLINDEWGRAQVQHMIDSLPITGDLVAKDFNTKPIIRDNSWLCTNNLIPKRTMEFNVGGVDCTAYKGEPYPFTNMWKVPLDPIVAVYEARGLKLKAPPRDTNRWVHIPVFQKN